MKTNNFTYGYMLGPNGSPIINEETAHYVKFIFEMTLQGMSQIKIAEWLKANKVLRKTGDTNWRDYSVAHIVQNKKYIGNGTYPPIISKELYDQVASIRATKNMYATQNWEYNDKFRDHRHAFSNKVICGSCGNIYTSTILRYNDGTKKQRWNCSNYFVEGKVCCENGAVEETILETTFIEAFQYFCIYFESLIKKTPNSFKFPHSETLQLIDTQIQEALDRPEKDIELINRLLTERTSHIWKDAQINDYDYMTQKLRTIIKKVNESPITFDTILFCDVIKQVTLYPNGKVAFLFINGIWLERTFKTGGKRSIENE